MQGVLPDNLRAERGQVVAAVALAGDVEVGRGLVGEGLANEDLEEAVHVLGGCEGVVGNGLVLVEIGEADAGRLVDEKHVCGSGPAVGIVHGAIAMVVDDAGSEFLHQPNHAGAAGAAGEPQRERIILWVAARLKVPEEEMLAADVEPAGVLRAPGVAEAVVLAFDADRVVGRRLALICHVRLSILISVEWLLSRRQNCADTEAPSRKRLHGDGKFAAPLQECSVSAPRVSTSNTLCNNARSSTRRRHEKE